MAQRDIKESRGSLTACRTESCSWPTALKTNFEWNCSALGRACDFSEEGGREGEKKNKRLFCCTAAPSAAPSRGGVPSPMTMLRSTCATRDVCFDTVVEISHSPPAPHSEPQLELIHMDDYFPLALVYCFGPGWQ